MLQPLDDKISEETAPRGCCSKLTAPIRKYWLGCCVCSVIVVSAMVPVGVFVIAPKVAQSIMDKTIINLPNSTMNPCTSSLESWIHNNAVITLNAPFPIMPTTTLHSFKQVLHTTTCNVSGQVVGGAECGSKAAPNLLGTYTSPEMKLNKGDNTNNFTVSMDLKDPAVITQGFILPMLTPVFSGAPGGKARLILSAEDVTISLLGVKIRGLKLHNELTCTGSQILPAVDNPICAKPENAAGYMMSCVAGDLSLTTTSTTAPTTTSTTTGQADVVV